MTIRRKHSYFFGIILLLSMLSACTSPKKIIYLQDLETNASQSFTQNYQPKIQPDDVLSIKVSAIDIEAAKPFNMYESTGTQLKPITYLVTASGTIHFPVLGTIKVAGLSTEALTAVVTKKLTTYIKNPIVNIRLLNFKITVLGEVNAPGTYQVPNERISILEAIGLAGDLTIQGKRSSVLLVREQDGKRTSVTIDLTDKDLLTSPYYYLAQNDVLYVEPNKAKINSSSVGASTGIIMSSISILISVIAIFTR